MAELNDHQAFKTVNFHHFLQMEKSATHLEIAEELGISIREVNALKKKISST